MPLIETKIDRESDDFQQNAAHNSKLAAQLRELTATIETGGSSRSRERHESRGKLLPRDRVGKLTDDDAPFLEIGTLAAHEVYGDDVPAAGLITGIGRVNDIECMIVANDATVKGGTYYPLTVKKHLRAQEIAEQNRLPRWSWARARRAVRMYLQCVMKPLSFETRERFFSAARRSSKPRQVKSSMQNRSAEAASIRVFRALPIISPMTTRMHSKSHAR
jgi:hypothetical protein